MEIIQGLQKVGGSSRIQTFRNAITTEEILVFDQVVADLQDRSPVNPGSCRGATYWPL